MTIRHLFTATFFLVFLAPVWNALEVARAEEALDRAMGFLTFTPCWGTGSMCGEQILAIGTIDATSASKLQALKPQPGTNVYFHSPVGSLGGGLALGAALRELHLN